MTDLEAQMADVQTWLARTGKSETVYIADATGLAASYLGRYREFFTAWESNAPSEIKAAVAAIAVKGIAKASGHLAPQDLEESPWEREFRRVMAWLRDVAQGVAELNVDWPGVQETMGHRASMSIRQPGA